MTKKVGVSMPDELHRRIARRVDLVDDRKPDNLSDSVREHVILGLAVINTVKDHPDVTLSDDRAEREYQVRQWLEDGFEAERRRTEANCSKH